MQALVVLWLLPHLRPPMPTLLSQCLRLCFRANIQAKMRCLRTSQLAEHMLCLTMLCTLSLLRI